MSIILVVDRETMPFRGYDDPGLPIGAWQAQGIQDGDASGGFNAIQINLESVTTSVGLFYSLEQLLVDHDENSSESGIVNISNFDHGGTLSKEFAFEIDAGTDGAMDSGIRIEQARPKIFLGKGSTPGSARAVTVQIDNVLGRALTVSASGYMWGPRSAVQTPGGIRRPVDGIFGT